MPKVTPKLREDAQAIQFQESFTIPSNHWLLVFPDDTYNILTEERFKAYYEINGVTISAARERVVPPQAPPPPPPEDDWSPPIEDEPDPVVSKNIKFTVARADLIRKLWGGVPLEQIWLRANKLPGKKIKSAGSVGSYGRTILNLPLTRRAPIQRRWTNARKVAEETYTPERRQFIADNFRSMETRELFDKVNALPGPPLRNRSSFSVWLPMHGYRRNGRVVRQSDQSLTPERETLLRTLYPLNLQWHEIQQRLNELPGPAIINVAVVRNWADRLGLRGEQQRPIGTRITRVGKMGLEATINEKPVSTTAQRVRVLAGLAAAEAKARQPIPETAVQAYLKPYDAAVATLRLNEMVDDGFVERSSSNPILWRVTPFGVSVARTLGPIADEYYQVT